MSVLRKAALGLSLCDINERASSLGRSTPRPPGQSPVADFFNRWSVKRRHPRRSDTLQTLMSNGEGKNTFPRDVISIEVHDNLGFISDGCESSSQNSSLDASFRFERVHPVTLHQPPPIYPSPVVENGHWSDADSIASSGSNTLKSPPSDEKNSRSRDVSMTSRDSDFDASDGSSVEFNYNEELARSLQELDSVCDGDGGEQLDDEQTKGERADDTLVLPSCAFSLRRDGNIRVDGLKPADPQNADSIQNGCISDSNDVDITSINSSPVISAASSNVSKTASTDFRRFTGGGRCLIPTFEVIPTLELPPEPWTHHASLYHHRPRTYSQQQRHILVCYQRKQLQAEYF